MQFDRAAKTSAANPYIHTHPPTHPPIHPPTHTHALICMYVYMYIHAFTYTYMSAVRSGGEKFGCESLYICSEALSC